MPSLALQSDPAPLEWRAASNAAYDALYATIPRAPLLQSRAYADAAAAGQRGERFLLCRGGAAVGLVQLLRAELGKGLIQAVILDRGPLFLTPDLRARWMGPVLEAFDARFPPRLGRRRRIIPEAGMVPRGALHRLNDQPGYQTIWLDLQRDATALRAGLRPKWRRDLDRAAEAEVAEDWMGDDLARLLDRHDAHRTATGYGGADRAMLIRLARRFLPAGQMLIERVGPAAAPLALALFLLHGRAATYQVGWVGPEGRAARAGHLCLWHGLLALKARGIRDLDLGGVNDADAAGVKRFKEGLGGDPVTLAGQFR